MTYEQGGMSGFAWNPLTKMWDAELEVWNSLFEAKPEAKRWMSTPVHNYDKLQRLFGKYRATGEDAEIAKEKSRRWAIECKQENGLERRKNGFIVEDIDNMVAMDLALLQSFKGVNDDQTFSTTTNDATSPAPNKTPTSSHSDKR